MYPSYPLTRTTWHHTNIFWCKATCPPCTKKTAPEGTVLRNSFVAAGLLAILQFDEDLAIATVLAVQRL